MIARLLLLLLALVAGAAHAKGESVQEERCMQSTAWFKPDPSGYVFPDPGAPVLWNAGAPNEGGQYLVQDFDGFNRFPWFLYGGPSGITLSFQLFMTPPSLPAGSYVTGLEMRLHAKAGPRPLRLYSAGVQNANLSTSASGTLLTLSASPLNGIDDRTFPQQIFGGPSFIWGERDGLGPITEWHNPAAWSSLVVSLAFANDANFPLTSVLVLDDIAFRLWYLPAPAAPGARTSGTATVTPSLRRARSIVQGALARCTVSASVSSARNLGARLPGGATGAAQVGVHLTRRAGGINQIILFPEAVGRGTMSATLRRGFAATASGSATLSASPQKARQTIASAACTANLGVNLIRQGQVSATSTASATVAASLQRIRTIAPSAAGTAAVAATVSAARPVAASSACTGAFSSQLLAQRPVSWMASCSATFGVDLRKARPVTAAIVGRGTISQVNFDRLFDQPSMLQLDVPAWPNGLDIQQYDNQVDIGEA